VLLYLYCLFICPVTTSVQCNSVCRCVYVSSSVCDAWSRFYNPGNSLRTRWQHSLCHRRPSMAAVHGRPLSPRWLHVRRPLPRMPSAWYLWHLGTEYCILSFLIVWFFCSSPDKTWRNSWRTLMARTSKIHRVVGLWMTCRLFSVAVEFVDGWQSWKVRSQNTLLHSLPIPHSAPTAFGRPGLRPDLLLVSCLIVVFMCPSNS